MNPPLSFAPFETKVLDIGQLLASIGASPSAVPEGGITIQQIGPYPALMASGKIVDPVTGFSSTIDFPAPERQLASALHAAGLPIGAPAKGSPYAGAGTFIPHVVVRNLSGATQTVTITLEYPQPAGSDASGQAAAQPASQTGVSTHDIRKTARALLPGGLSNHPEWGAGTGAATASKTVLAYMPIGPYSTEDFSLAAALNQLPLPLPFCSVRIQYSGAPGSAQAQVSSVEENNNLIVDATPQNEGDGWAGSGANPWHIDKNTESVLFLTNMGDKPSRIAFEVTANNVHYYLTQLVLIPHETRAIDLRALRDAQTPDLKGNRIPANATDGSVNWVRADLVPVTGRVVVINRNDGIASSFDCCTGNCPSSDISMYFSNAPATIDVGSSNLQLAPVINDEDCNYNWYFIDGGYNDCTWNDSYTSVATVDSTGWVTGVAGGVTTITMYANGMQYDCSNNCTQTPTQLDASGSTTVMINVQITSTTIVSPNPTTINAYTQPTSTTLTVQVQYQAVSVNTNPSPSVTLEVGNASGNPPGNTVSLSPPSRPLSFQGAAGYLVETFAINGATQNGSVVIQASLANPSAGVVIQPPSPASNGQATVNTTTK